MATAVEFTDKSGKAQRSVFGDDAAAAKYAATIKGAKLVPVAAVVPVPTVTVCKPATAEDVKASTGAYYDRHWNPRADREEAVTSEQRAERRMEYVSQGRLMGGDVNDLLADLDGG